MTSAQSSARPHENPRSREIAAFVAIYLVWGSTYLAISFAVESIPPLLMVGMRFMVSGAVLYMWSRWRGQPGPTKPEWRDAFVTGLLLCCGNGAVAWAEQRVPSGLAALLVAIVPLWMVVVDWLRPRGVRPRVSVIAGLVVGLVGLYVLIGPTTIVGHGDVDRLAAVVLVVASLSWATGSVYNRYGARPGSASMSTGMQMMAGSVVLLVVSIGVGELGTFHIGHVSFASWMGWLYLVTFGSIVGFTAYVYLLRTVSPAKVSTYAYVNPVVAVFLGWALAGEPVTMRTLVAAAIILGGVALITISQNNAV